MAAAQPAYDYAAYGYAYDSNAAAAAAYPTYPGYESNGAYATPAAYDGYATSGAYHTSAQTSSSYPAVDPYSGYPAAAYAYPTATAPTPLPSPAQTSQATYSYDARRAPSPAMSAAYEYPHYKPAPVSNGAPTAGVYGNYHPPSAYGVAPPSHMTGTMGPPPTGHMYGPAPTAPAMVPRRPEYYPQPLPPPVAHPMHYVQQAPQSMPPYRLPPRGGYQRELDEPGDENALLRHVAYITGLPKEIQNETLAEVFGAACGPIAPVDVRSPKPKIWVYKDRQTREGKGEATITFVSPESAQMAISYFNGRELFGREVRVTLCPRRMYNMQKQNTPFNPGAPPVSTTTPIASMIKPIPTHTAPTTTTSAAAAATPVTSTTTAAVVTTAPSTTTTTNTVSAANPIATISSSTLGLPRQLNHSLFKLRQTPEQQRGLLPTPPIPYGAPMMGNGLQRDGVRKELPRIALTRGNYANPGGIRPKPY